MLGQRGVELGDFAAGIAIVQTFFTVLAEVILAVGNASGLPFFRFSSSLSLTVNPNNSNKARTPGSLPSVPVMNACSRS